MLDLLVIGAGYVGGEVARFFSSEDKKVAGLVRSEKSADALARSCIQPIVADITQPESLVDLPEAKWILICPSANERTVEGYQKIYIEGIGNVLKRLTSPEHVIYLSSTGVYGDQSGEWIDENIPAVPDSPRGEILLEAEKRILASGFPASIFRLAGIYGSGRNRISALREGRKNPEEETGDRYINLIHRSDIVRAVALLFRQAKPGSIYLGVDDEPVLASEFYRWLALRLGLPSSSAPEPSTSVGGKRCRNGKLKALGFQFRFPTFREGYESLLTHGDSK